MANEKLTDLLTSNPATTLDPTDLLYITNDRASTPDSAAITVANALRTYQQTVAEISAGVTPTDYSYEPLNVLRYGATGDGTTDDYTAITNAIAVSDQAYFGGQPYVIYFPTCAGNTGRYMVSQTITVNRNGHHWIGEKSVRRSQPVAIALTAAAAPTVLLDYTGEAPCFENLSFEGNTSTDKATTLVELHPAPRLPRASEIAALGLDSGTLYNFEDVDAEFNNCNFSHGDVAIDVYGRGLYVDTSEIFNCTVGIDLNRETNFQQFENAGVETDTGMRVYCIRNNRFHGMGASSTCIRNVGTHKDVVGGVEFTGNIIDTVCGVMFGPIKNSHFDCLHMGIEDRVFDANSTADSLGDGSGIYENVSIYGTYSAYMFRNERTATDTTLDVGEATSSTVLDVASTTGFSVDDIVLVQLDNGQTHRTTVASISAGVSLTVNDGLPSAAASGNIVWLVLPRQADNFLYADGATNVNINVSVADIVKDVIRVDGPVNSLSIDGSFYNVMTDGASAWYSLLKLNGADFKGVKVSGAVQTPASLTSSPAMVAAVGTFTLIDFDFSGLAFNKSQFVEFESVASVSPWGAADATPSVMGRNFVETNTSAVTITDLDDGAIGQEVTVISKGAITFDTTGTNLVGSSVDIVTADGDVTKWHCEDGTTWRLMAYVDVSVDNSAGA